MLNHKGLAKDHPG